MAQVFKYHIDNDTTKIEMPLDAEILSVQNQHGKMVIWASVDPSRPIVVRTFVKVLTGHHIDDQSSKYIGTVQFDDGNYVEHLFEIIKR